MSRRKVRSPDGEGIDIGAEHVGHAGHTRVWKWRQRGRTLIQGYPELLGKTS